MTEKHFDVLVVGAGPSGSAVAIKLANSGLAVALLDKARFPRDKTCGDALSVDVINQLAILSEDLAAEFAKMDNRVESFGVKIFSPDHNHINIPYIHKGSKSCGFITPRLSFDNLLFQHTKTYSNITTFENCTVSSVTVKNEKVIVQSSHGIFTGQVIVGADGAHSIVSKSLGDSKVEKKHYSAGLRVYYENVTHLHEENFIELHFFPELLPGYLWVFPMAGNKANVGLGMPSSEVAKRRLNLKVLLTNLITTHPDLRERFKQARPLETIKGYGLPLGSKKRNLSGERFLLTGDAASLIDPFSGEGIANAIRSGRIAAEHILTCFEKNNFSADFNKAYDKEIYRRMWNELRISRTLQKLVRYPRLSNYLVKKANQNKHLQEFLIQTLADVEQKKKFLWKPSFYYRMFFNRR